MEKAGANRADESEMNSSSGLVSEQAPGGLPDEVPFRFPIVGIGASAGGLAAFEAFFAGMPPGIEPGMAFVLVQHLAPDHKSILTELIRRYTSMQVYEVEDGMVVKPNCAYIIPPNRDMAFLHGTLQLMEPSAPRGQRLPIDFFFRSLAQDQRERAICIVLSGTGSDGTLGVRAIKGEGGMAMAQKTETTEFDGMPRSAIGTGLVDYVLSPAEMPTLLIAYTEHAFSRLQNQLGNHALGEENSFKKIFVLLRVQTGHDFSMYKPSTVQRRIERRMAVHQIDTLDKYLKYLQKTPIELEALFRDLLIGVTSFFRDPEAFQMLEESIIPRLFAGKAGDALIRVWSPGCSTGEEAYSIAMLLQERLESMKQNCRVQIFATDIDSLAIATARAGVYPASIAADLTPERLNRFFSPEPGGADGGPGFYRIHKSIRDMLVFSEQSVIKDPPFSRLDLVCCRNLLIYMGAELQKILLPVFHYALNPGGYLFLGSSETVGEFSDLFSVLDRKSKLFQRKEDIHSAHRLTFGRVLMPITGHGVHPVRNTVKGAATGKLPLRELTEKALLQQVAPAAALVNGDGDILYLHGRTGMFLEPVPGEAGVSNILKMARPGLNPELTNALRKATTGDSIVSKPGLRVKTNGDFTTVNLTVRLVNTDSAQKTGLPLYLVVLQVVLPQDMAPSHTSDALKPGVCSGQPGQEKDTEACIAVLQDELRAKDEYLQNANEELETSNEELKSSNEEMQSVNEELQSTNEELETSREELQSINEELSTVNSELQTKVSDLFRANNDMNNLLAGTGIGTIFVDFQLRIIRFTPMVTSIVNLIESDLGRPVGHIVYNLTGYVNLVTDIRSVLDTLLPKEAEVQTITGRWYAMRIQPYRTLDNVIEGAVITFVDITEMKEVREALRKANELKRLALAVHDARDAIIVQDLNGGILAWNPGAVRLYGWSEDEALAMNVREIIPLELREDAMASLLVHIKSEILELFFTRRVTRDGSLLDVSVVSTPLFDRNDNVYAVTTTERPGVPVGNSRGKEKK